MATMRDVARRRRASARRPSRGCSTTTRTCIPATKERVESALRELSYVPSTLATTFRSGRAPVIGVAVPDIADPFFGAIAKAVETLAAEHDMSVVITSLGDDPAREPRDRPVAAAAVAERPGHRPDRARPVLPRPRGPTARRSCSSTVARPASLADSFTEDDHAGAYAGHAAPRRARPRPDRLPRRQHATIPTTSGRLAGLPGGAGRLGRSRPTSRWSCSAPSTAHPPPRPSPALEQPGRPAHGALLVQRTGHDEPGAACIAHGRPGPRRLRGLPDGGHARRRPSP